MKPFQGREFSGWLPWVASRFAGQPRADCCNPLGIVNCLHLDAFAGFGLDDFDLGPAGADLLLEPLARIVVAMAEEDGVGRNLADEVQQFITVGVGGEVESPPFRNGGVISHAALPLKTKGLPGAQRP